MKRLSVFFLLSCLCGLISAQNINQTVEVSKDYLSSPVVRQKNGVEMFVPDSVLKFKLNFDYDVFQKPYQGAYEFSPYSVSFTPSVGEYDGKKFYLKVGAGYTIKPVLDAVFIPMCDSVKTFALYQKFSGYYGMYVQNYRGYEFKENIGFNGRYIMKKLSLKYDAGYKGFFVNNSTASMANMGYASVGISSLDKGETYFHYDINLGYKFISDRKFQTFPVINEHLFLLGGSLEQVIKNRFKITVDFDLNYQMYSGVPQQAKSSWNRTNLTADNVIPKLGLNFDFLDLSLGAVLSYSNDGVSRFKFYPDASLNIKISDFMKVYGQLSGGAYITDYIQVKEEDIWCSEIMNPNQWIQTSFNDLNITAGIKGRIGTHFSYDLFGNKSKIVNGNLPSIYQYRMFLNYNLTKLGGTLMWNSDRLSADAGVLFQSTDIMAHEEVFDLPRLSGHASVTYNFAKRVYVGVSALGSSARYAFVNPGEVKSSFSMPAYVDLGANFKFFFTKRFAAWVEASNLLGHEKSNHYNVSKKDRAVVVGISLYR